MKPGAGKRKGSGWERDVCRFLSKWISGGKESDLFTRTASSGGRATIAMRGGQKDRQVGDVIGISGDAVRFSRNMVVECKNVRYSQFFLFMSCRKGIIRKWLEKLKKERDDAARPTALLFLKENRQHPVVFVLEPSRWFFIPLHVFESQFTFNPKTGRLARKSEDGSYFDSYK